MTEQGCYIGVHKIAGVPQRFIQTQVWEVVSCVQTMVGGTMSKVDLGVGRARVRPRATSGSPPGSEQASCSSHRMPATGLPVNLVPAWVLVGGGVHVGVQGGRARVRRDA